MDNNNLLFLAAFVLVIYFLFVREREGLEPEIPPPAPEAQMVQPPVPVPEPVPMPVPAPAPVPMPVAMPVPVVSSGMSNGEKDAVLYSLVPLLSSGNASYDSYVSHLLATNNKSKKLLRRESYDKIVSMGMTGNLNVAELYSLMDDA